MLSVHVSVTGEAGCLPRMKMWIMWPNGGVREPRARQGAVGVVLLRVIVPSSPEFVKSTFDSSLVSEMARE